MKTSLCFPPLSGNWYQIEKKSPRKGTKTELSFAQMSPYVSREDPRERGRDVFDLVLCFLNNWHLSQLPNQVRSEE